MTAWVLPGCIRIRHEGDGLILQVRGGPSLTDNELIQSCAKVARDAIGPAQIKVEPVRPGSAG